MMDMKMLQNTIDSIAPTADLTLEQKVQNHLDDLTKPKGSLGRLEEFAMKYCLCRGSETPNIRKMKLFTFAGDHGILAEGVAPFPKEVTCQMVHNMCAGGAAVSVMCKSSGIDYSVVDMGVDADFDVHPSLIASKIARGTASFRSGNAMTSDLCMNALQAGMDIAQQTDSDLVGIGEMGIGNTSPASALYSLLLDIDPEKTVGAGTGATGALLDNKKKVIREAVLFHRGSWNKTAFDALQRVGGFEIAGMAGFILGSALKRIPIVVDGFIASSAALVAMKMAPHAGDYLYFAHSSAESFHNSFLSAMNISPVLQLEMRLGEGTGSALAMHIISQAINCYNQMATFSSAGVSEKN